MSKQRGRENDSVSVEVTAGKSEVALREETIFNYWQEHNIFQQSIETPAGGEPKGNFVFYDGPPFATGLPHYGHILASAIKDAVPRFWTMRGYRVRRQWGWDCHGLPLENLIEKKLGLATKRDIEAYGVKNFNEAARATVMEYADDWKRIIPRMGRWSDMENDYKTMNSSYTESVWWAFSELNKKGLVYEGFKTMHLCPRCGTTLSNFEVNQGYKDIKDIAVTVKLPLLDDAGKPTDESLLVWTTTPWTLPGNLAAAVNQDLVYVKVRVTKDDRSEMVILAKDRLAQLYGVEHEVLDTIPGRALVGRRYQPPFPWLAGQDFDQTNAWKIRHADYVELGEEGTGAVHIAPAYGEDDMQLAKANQIPIVHHVDEAGHFKKFVDGFECQLVKPKDDDEAGITHLDADIEVVKRLNAAGLLLKKENITHSYPHCWRCDTPLLNYATTSWFVNVPRIKDQLVAENNKVHWVPEHVGQSRFGNWLEGARDWAISRQRYWGAPLPIWRNPVTKATKVFGSLADLQAYVPKSGNHYQLLRHGQSQSSVQGIVSARRDNEDALTELGRTQVELAIANIEAPDIIIHSGFMRTRETAELVAQAFKTAEVKEDTRFGEIDIAALYEGKTWDDYNAQFATWEARYTTPVSGIENRRDAQIRMGQLLFELDQTYHDKKILIVSHSGTLFALESAALGLEPAAAAEHYEKQGSFGNAEVRNLNFVPYPHNDYYELDYHRPYIDDIKLFEEGVELERIPDVFDCWFESGSMPFAQHHYLGQSEDFQPRHFPAQFIAEGLDQTRGWFYSLLVLGTALFGQSPYQNVIVNGLIMAEDGKKLSKKLQNYSAPEDLVNQVGADAMRMYLLSSPVIRGEDLNFSDREVLDLQRKNIGRLNNVLAMYEMYAEEGVVANQTSGHPLDRWIIDRLNQLIAEATAGYENYELDKATRPIADFIDDLSVWYLRRSRERLKSGDVEDKTLALGTLRYILRELAKVMAPVMPFYADYLFLAVRNQDEANSVHLTAWPSGGEVDTELLAAMVTARNVVTAALEARTKSGIKVRQPIASVSGPALLPSLVPVVLDELNAKDYLSAATVAIDDVLTPALLAEGAVRELIRSVQEMRKETGLLPSDVVDLKITTDERGQAAINEHLSSLTNTVNAKAIEFGDTTGTVVVAGDYQFVVSLLV